MEESTGELPKIAPPQRERDRWQKTEYRAGERRRRPHVQREGERQALWSKSFQHNCPASYDVWSQRVAPEALRTLHPLPIVARRALRDPSALGRPDRAPRKAREFLGCSGRPGRNKSSGCSATTSGHRSLFADEVDLGYEEAIVEDHQLPQFYLFTSPTRDIWYLFLASLFGPENK